MSSNEIEDNESFKYISFQTSNITITTQITTKSEVERNSWEKYWMQGFIHIILEFRPFELEYHVWTLASILNVFHS